MTWRLDRTFPAAAGVLADLRVLVRDTCRRAGCTEEVCEQMVLAINEACMNIIQHGYGYADGKFFRLRLKVEEGLLIAQLLDNGPPVSEEDLRPRALDDIRPGGLGVRFIRESMDEMRYVPAPEGFTNCLQLNKRIC